MKCKNHPKTDANGTCVECGNFFCDACLIQVKGKNHCKQCTADLLAKHEQKAKEANNPQIIIQQQQSAASPTANANKPHGSYFWLCFWLVVFFPVAIVYYLMRRWD